MVLSQTKRSARVEMLSGRETQIGLYAAEVKRAAEDAERSAESARAAEAGAIAAVESERYLPIPGKNGNWQIWDREHKKYVDSGETCLGEQGPQGPQGERGFAPLVTAERTFGGVQITVTRQTAENAFESSRTMVHDGNNGVTYVPTVENGILSWAPTPIPGDLVDPVSIIGPKGDKGDKGEKGERGDKGDPGDVSADERINGVLQATEISTIGPAAIATFDASAANMPLKGLTVGIEPVQAGSSDPSPENVRPITGWTGCSIVNASAPQQTYSIEPIQEGSGDPSPTNIRPIEPGLSFQRDDGTTLDIYGGTLDVVTGKLTKTHQVRTFTGQETGWKSITSDGQRYYISKPTNSLQTNTNVGYKCSHSNSIWARGNNGIWGTIVVGSDIFKFLDSEQHFADLSAFKAWLVEQNANGTPVQIVYPLATPVVYNLTATELVRALAELGVAAGSYSIIFPTEAGTVYGGTLDVVEKKLTVDRAVVIVDDASILSDAVAMFYFRPTLRPIHPASIPPISNTVASITITSNQYILFNDRIEDETAEAYLTRHGGSITVVYEITPIVYDLSDIPDFITLLGTNNIWADCGSVTVTYGAYVQQVKEYAKQYGDSILSAIAPLEATYTASRAYAVGTYLFVGTKFYKVTQAIAGGGTITPGTNVTQTTVAEQLIALTAG